ncbi:MAG: ferritin [Verrucomicrobiota bacterium]|nr:ferritin [Verrucomicrobiota bacterium]
MLTSQKVIDALNEQVGNELAASHQYVAIASHFSAEALMELSAFFFKEADEERDHATKFIKFIVELGGRVIIPEIPAPANQFVKAEEAIKLSLDQELKVTSQINELVNVAMAEKDHITFNFLQFFLQAQLEEVSTMDALHKVVLRAGEGNLLRVEEYVARSKGKPGGPAGF